MQNRNLVFSAACLGMLLFGITLTTLGSILPELIPQYGMSRARAGSLFSAMNLGILVGSLFFGPVVDRYGYKRLLLASTLLLLAGLEGIAFAGSIQVLTLFILLFGFGGGIINGATNALVSDISGEGRGAGLALLGVFFGIGAFGVPLLMGTLLNFFSYTEILGGLGAIVVIAFIVFLAIRFPEPKHPQGIPIRKALALLRNPAMLLLGFILFFQSGMEILTGGWTATFFNEVLMIGTGTSVFLLSFFWIGLVLSRLVLSRLLRKSSPALLLKICIGTAFAGSLLLLASEYKLTATLGIFILGAGLGAGFPVILGYIGDLYPGMSGTAYSLGFTMALTGGMLLPWLAGIIGDRYGLRTSFFIVPVALLCVTVLLLAVLRILSRDYSEQVNI